jgi:hypothetical protein
VSGGGNGRYPIQFSKTNRAFVINQNTFNPKNPAPSLLVSLNSEQEELKAQLKAKTDELSAKMKEARAKNANLSKRIKVATAQENWVAFGITAKR